MASTSCRSARGLTPWRRFLQFHNLLIYVLLASMAMTLVLGQC